jgi:hypothetical protein
LWNQYLIVPIFEGEDLLVCRFIFVTFLQVGKLRHRFINSIAPNGLAADRRGVIPASAFCISAMQIWKVIQENKDLNLPAHKVSLLCFLIDSAVR